MNQVNPQLIVTVGNTSLQRILGAKFNVGQNHGKIYHQAIQCLNETGGGYTLTKRQYTVILTFHPVAVFYNRKLAPAIQTD